VTIKEDSMTITRDHDLQLADGRVLRYQIVDTAHGDAVFLLHGALGSRLVHNSLSAAASDAGIRLVSYDRPGYGGSTRSRAAPSPPPPTTSRQSRTS
jgi:pimeloyl-ACP methyl ester carboxylesterase